MTLDLDHLSKLAEAATPGPWTGYRGSKSAAASVGSLGGHIAILRHRRKSMYSDERTPEQMGNDAVFIAALDPATVQELIRLARLGMERLAETAPTGREYIGKYATQTMLQEATKRAAKEG